MKQILVVGGANGIGLSIAMVLAERPETEKVYILDKCRLSPQYKRPNVESIQFNLVNDDYSIFNAFSDIDGLIITAGFGKLALFDNIDESLISQYFNVNTISPIRIIKHFYKKLLSKEDFFCGVMVSIAGFMSSPFFSVYGATKAALKIFIESINVELEKTGSKNRILNISPGSIKGTSFNQGETDINQLTPLAREIIYHIEKKDDLFIPQYEDVYKHVLKRYQDDFREEGRHSYEYKLKSGRI